MVVDAFEFLVYGIRHANNLKGPKPIYVVTIWKRKDFIPRSYVKWSSLLYSWVNSVRLTAKLHEKQATAIWPVDGLRLAETSNIWWIKTTIALISITFNNETERVV